MKGKKIPFPGQVEALELLAQKFPFIDLQRLGIYGWSYGGYLALMAMAQHKEVFKVFF